ncbi:MAG TPA: phosphoribosyltransferase family protein [Gaiellaceae bacterium]|nr:phosphoribosyltransferase family protein [Gaiellaceae bacterium]
MAGAGDGLVERLRAAGQPIGDVYLTRGEIAQRVRELGAALAADYAGREPLLVAPLKSSAVFLADLSRALPVPHRLDFVELAAYSGDGGSVRVVKDLDAAVGGRDVVVVEDVVDTGLTLNFLVRTLSLRQPRSVAAVTLLDRPYRRLVDVPLTQIGFTVPDELFAGYGLGLDERWRALPDLHVVEAQELAPSLTGDRFRDDEPEAAAA